MSDTPATEPKLSLKMRAKQFGSFLTGWITSKKPRAVSKKTDIFFDTYDRPVVSRYFLFLIAVSIFIFSGKLAVDLKYFHLTPDRVEALSTISGLALSFLGGFLAIFIINNNNIKRLNVVRNLGADGILKELFSTLSRYEGMHSENKIVDLRFDNLIKTSDNIAKAVFCTLTVTQNMHLKSKLRLGFQVLSRSDNGVDKTLMVLSDSDALDDLISMDMSEIADIKDEIDITQFGIVEIRIDNKIQSPVIEQRQNGLQVWTVDTSKYSLDSNPTSLQYIYKYVQEVPGFAFFETHQPTRGFTCIIDSTMIKDELSVYALETINPDKYSHQVSALPERFDISTDQWLLPRRNVVFCWYPKD